MDERLPLVDPVGVDDDEAVLLLPEDLVQPDDVDRPRLDDVVEQVARADRRELVLVADEDEAHPRRDGLEEVVHQRQVDHRELVDDEGLALERVGLVALEGPLLGLELEDAVDVRASRPVASASRLAARPVGAARRTVLAPFAEDVGDGPDDGRLAGARAAGDDQDLPLERFPDGLPLERREGRCRGPFRPRAIGLVEVEVGRPAGEAGQLMDGPDDILLGLGEERQVERPCPPARSSATTLPALRSDGQGPVDLVRRRRSSSAAHFPATSAATREDVALLVVLFEYIEDVGLDPLERGRVQAELEGDLVGGLESDAPDVEAELIGVGLEDREGPLAVLPVDLRGQAGRDAVLLEEHDQVADVLVLGPGPADLL